MMHVLSLVTKPNVEFRTSFHVYIVRCNASKGCKNDHGNRWKGLVVWWMAILLQVLEGYMWLWVGPWSCPRN